ncbi:hypothetical protein TraAM80_05045 [Trypanosoma rangeli]|uniref:Tetratricopeptide repeat n=1 Tax=Trypanosoma rangeli TaxID=5698 RepID=A0A3R7KMM4_TRYRA|nr:uncharacterized protein TraAM80_05045 [Trypanosoma rangeli]RNF04711.1 hypothetical protein TraAM80_05045 [Trypanosoma rangeli]|eukprot:RNF04711.1 hypothetical protein TraAM80_05045 [Trypanosoma rangeli]
MQDAASMAEYRMGGNAAEDDVRRDVATSETISEEQAMHQSEDELLHEVLAMNTLAMQRCNAEALEEASTILSDAYMKLHNLSSPGSDTQIMDTLRSTTLNNLGVVECHRGQHRQALSHFEAARQLEEKWGSASPSVALNTCAAYNALGMYDKATAAAMETIDMLRTLKLQEKNGHAPTLPVPDTGNRSLQGTGIAVAKSDNKALWGAAWHNLAVAQINTARYTKDPSEHSNAAVLFQNAMRATQELLGSDHPMTKSVTETYRTVRDVLRSYGVYKQHHTMLTVPPRPVDPRDEEDDMERYLRQCVGKSRRRAKEKFHRDLTITFCGEATHGAKLTERLDPRPYPDAVDVAFRCKRRKKMPSVLRGMMLSGTLLRAGQLYGNPHPLLYSLPPNYNAMEPETPKDGHVVGTDTFPGMTSNPRAAASVKRSPAKQRKGSPTQKPAFTSQTQSDPNFKRTPPRERQPPFAHQQATADYQEDRSAYQQPSPSYKSTPPIHEEAPSEYQQAASKNYQQTPSSSQPRRARNGNVPKDRRVASGKAAPPSKASSGFRDSVADPQVPQKVLPPLGKAPVRGGVVSRPAGRAPDEAGNENLQPRRASKGSMPTVGPTYEQVKYILLAEPQDSQRQQRGRVEQCVHDSSTGRPSLLVDTSRQEMGGELLALTDGSKTHRLFDAMWVSGKESMDASGARAVGRPSYYVSSVLDMSKDSVLMPEEVLQMMVTSASSSEGDIPRMIATSSIHGTE